MCLLRLKKNGPMAVLDVLAGRFCSFTSHLFGRLITGYQLSKKWGLGKWQPLGGVGSKISSTRTLAGNLRCGEVEQNKKFCFKESNTKFLLGLPQLFGGSTPEYNIDNIF